ncbi:MAG TPA: autotransporter-associated beta strand repeat-containing protein [Lacibacter sp.]|nr:autotransporter-associated beta strand repeat-containing protein [Lacibacter sp.]HMO88795.1 autotransporter-associated beta strand repeat-containing protein [Lacibacter sp.]
MRWRKFRTDASGAATSDRAMQVGDELVVRLSATRAFGKIGFALLASPATGTWANRESNYAISVNLDGPAYTGGAWGNWYIRFNTGSTSAASFGGLEGTFRNFTFTMRLTAPNRMNITITDGTNTSTFNDVALNTTNPITDCSFFLENDWDNSFNRNIFWGLGADNTQHSLTNTLALPVGQSNNNFTIGTVISNGLVSNSTSSVSVNSLTKSGTGNVTMTNNNTYTGLTTITAGTLTLNAAPVLPATNAITINGGTLTIANAGALSSSNNITLSTGTLALGAVASASTSNIGSLTFSGGTTLSLAAAPASCSLMVAATAGFATGNLTITGWVPTKRIIITDISHINDPVLLGRINFFGYGVGAKLINGNELVPQLLFVTNGTNGGNFDVDGSWLNNDRPTANNGTESIFVQAGDVLVQNTNFNVLNANVSGTLSMNAVNTITLAGTGAFNHSGSINMASGSVITMNAGATWNNTGGTFTGSPTGRITFVGAGTITGSGTFPDVHIGGGVNFGTGTITIGNGSTLTINGGGFVATNAPFYATGSRLTYNTGAGTFQRGAEWQPGISGRGVPHHVQVNTGATLNLDVSPAFNANEARTCLGDLDLYGILTMGGTVAEGGSMDEDLSVRGNVTIFSTGTLRLGCQEPFTQVTGDLLLGGNWLRLSGGNFFGSQRAIIFDGSNALQTVERVGDAENIPYFIIAKPAAGTVRLLSDVNVNGENQGHPFQLLNGTLDLNGRTLVFRTFNTTAHEGIRIDGSAGNLVRNVISSAGPASFTFTHGNATDRIATVSRNSTALSTLSFGTNVVVQISRTGGGLSGVDFGNALTTINGTLQINGGGFVSTNPPTYTDNSLLQYNTGGNYNRSVEWSTAASGPGHPFNVQISNSGTNFRAGRFDGTYTAIPLNLRGSITVDAGTTFNMTTFDGGTNMTVPLTVGFDVIINGTLLASQAGGGGIVLGRNWVRNSGGVFTPYQRTVTFNVSRDATITAPAPGETYYNLAINKPGTGIMGNMTTPYLGYRVTLNSPVVVSNGLTLTSGIFVTTATNIMTLNDAATATGGAVESFVSGPLRKNGTANFRFPVGKIVNTVPPFAYHYRPIEIGALGGTSFAYTAEFIRQDPYTQGLISALARAANLQSISRCEYWDLTRTGGPTTIQVTASWSTHSVWPSQCNVGSYVNDVPSLVVVPFNGPSPLPGPSQWGDADFGQSATGTGNQAYINTIRWDGPLNYNKFVLGTIDANFNPLPFKLVRFEGRGQGSAIALQWEVEGNHLQQEYQLEHSTDGQRFTRIATVPATELLTRANYRHLHGQPAGGLNHYRLSVIDREGRNRQSQTIQVWVQTPGVRPGLYPNPVTGSHATFYTGNLPKGTYQVQLLGSDGRLLLQQRRVHDGQQPVWQIDLPPALSGGVYWLHIAGPPQDPIRIKLVR